MENLFTTHNHEKGEFASSQSRGYDLDFKNQQCLIQHPSGKYLSLIHILEVYKFASLQGLTRVESFEKSLRWKPRWQKWFEWDWLIFSLLKNCQSFIKFIYENVLKMHGPRSKFIMKVVQV